MSGQTNRRMPMRTTIALTAGLHVIYVVLPDCDAGEESGFAAFPDHGNQTLQNCGERQYAERTAVLIRLAPELIPPQWFGPRPGAHMIPSSSQRTGPPFCRWSIFRAWPCHRGRHYRCPSRRRMRAVPTAAVVPANAGTDNHRSMFVARMLIARPASPRHHAVWIPGRH
jgi:hypothetical protein